MKRIVWLDVGRGVSIILVVMYHVILMSNQMGVEVASVYEQLNEPIQLVRMPLFFSMSALLIGTKIAADWETYAIKYLAVTAWLFVLWNLIYTIVQGRPPLWIATGLFYPPHMTSHLWFLWALLIYRFGAKVLALYRLQVICILAAISIVTFERLGGTGDYSFAAKNILKYWVFFAVFSWYGREIAREIDKRPWLSLAAALCLAAVCWITWFRFGFAVGGVIAAICLSIMIARYFTLLTRFFSWFGRSSLEIFLLHILALMGLIPILAGVPLIAVLGLPMFTILSIFASIGLYRMFNPIAPWLFAMPRFGRLIAERKS